MGFGAYDEDEDQQDRDMNLGETEEESRIDYEGDVEYTGSTEELWDTYQNEVKDDEEDEKYDSGEDVEEEFDVDEPDLSWG